MRITIRIGLLINTMRIQIGIGKTVKTGDAVGAVEGATHDFIQMRREGIVEVLKEVHLLRLHREGQGIKSAAEHMLLFSIWKT